MITNNNTLTTKATSYRAITSDKTVEFNETINKLLSKGWALFGGMSLFEENEVVYYNQVLVKLVDEQTQGSEVRIKN